MSNVGAATNFGLNQNFKYYEIELDSEDATATYSTSEVSTDWPVFQLQTPIPNVAAIKILEVQIPMTWYTVPNIPVTSPANTQDPGYMFTYFDISGFASISVQYGNYTAVALASAIQTAIRALPFATVAGFSVGYSTQTGLFSFTNTTVNFTLTFYGMSMGTYYGPLLGFGPISPINTSTTFSSTAFSLSSSQYAQVSGPNYLYINSRLIGPSVGTVLPAGAKQLGSGSQGPQITKIPVSVQPGGIVYWQDPDPQKWFTLNNMALLTQFDMYLTLGNNALPFGCLRLNGQGFSVKLGLLQYQKVAASEENTSISGSTTIGPVSRKRAA